MKKILKFAAAAVLAGMTFTASAWWGWGGPWGGPGWGGPWGGPGWGGYYPYDGYGYAPVLVAPPVVAPQGANAFAPWGADPFASDFGSFPEAPAMSEDFEKRVKESEAEREQARAASAARAEASRKAAEARRAEMAAQSQAFRDSMGGMSGMGGYPAFPAAPFSAPAPAPSN